MTSIFHSIASPSSMLYWLNLAIAVTLTCSASLLFVNLFQKRSEVFRHALMVVSLIVLLVAPVAVWIAGHSQLGLLSIKDSYLLENTTNLPIETSSEVHSQHEELEIVPIIVDQDVFNSEIENVSKNELSETEPVFTARKATSTTPLYRSRIAWGQIGLSLFLIIWCCGTIWCFIQTIRGWKLVYKYFHLSTPITEESLLLANKIATQKVGLTNIPSIFKSPSVPVPLSTGVFYSAIILPESFLRNANQDELEAVLIHELAHIVRRDHRVGLIQRLTVAIYWWNPLVYYINHICSSLAEEICDDYVAKSQKSSENFAHLLVAMAEGVVDSLDVSPAIGILSSRRHDLERRVTRLMQKERKVKIRLSLNHVAMAVLFGLLMTGTSVLSTVWADSQAEISADSAGNASTSTKDVAANSTSSSIDATGEEKVSTEEPLKEGSETSSTSENATTTGKSVVLPQTTLLLLNEKDGNGFKRLSPDGTKMVHIKDSLITVWELSTGLEQKYAQAVGYYPEWSLDGKKIAYLDQEDATDVTERKISILTLDSGKVEKTNIYNAVPRGWSRDGRFLLVVDPRRDEKHEGLQLVNLETGEKQVVVKPYKHYITRFPRLSPDGKYVVYMDSVGEEKTDIFVQPIGEDKPIRIASHKGTDSNPLWLADGKQILFMSNRTLGRWDLLSVDFQDGKPLGEPKIIVQGIGTNVSLLSCSESGHLLFTRGNMRSVISSTKVDPASGSISNDVVHLSDNDHIDTAPNWSRNGKFISYYEQTPEFELLLCMMNSDGSNKTKLLRVSAYSGAMAWLPDNEHILYPGFQKNPENPEENLHGIYSVSIRTRQRKLVFQDPEFWGHMNLSPDAKHLAIVTSVKKKYQLYRIDYDGQNRQQLVTSDDSIWCPTFTPDGKEIIYTHEVRKEGKTIRNSIMAVPFEGGVPRELYTSNNPTDYFDTSGSTWLPDGRYVFDIRTNPGGRYHYALSLDGKSKPVKLSYKKGVRFRVSPDGTQAVFRNGKYNWKLWLMSGFLPKDELVKK